MPNLTGAILVEIIGCDVVTWRLNAVERQTIVLGIDTPNLAGVIVADSLGLVPGVSVVPTAHSTSVQFTKRSPSVSVLHRRTDFVNATPTGFRYLDSWRFDYQRFMAVLFPQHTVFTTLTPPTLTAALDQWQERPVFQTLTHGLMVEAIYRCDPAAFVLAHLPFGVPPDLATVTAQLPYPDLATAETLRAATAADPQAAALLADSVWLGPLIRGGAP
ncbi:MAG: hypothetical protein M3Z04_17765 [Chloroflexota bacterium]|nr:hypothetical protein [Chloroflexota bacterium]